jgi:hypothetical protein
MALATGDLRRARQCLARAHGVAERLGQERELADVVTKREEVETKLGGSRVAQR